MSEKSAALKEAKEVKPDTISLTQTLIGMGGVDCELVDLMADGTQQRHLMDVRSAVLLAIKQGSNTAAKNGQLSDSEQTRCWTLGNAIANEANTGYSFTAEDIVLVKKLAKLRFPGVEPYMPLLAAIDPAGANGDKD